MTINDLENLLEFAKKAANKAAQLMLNFDQAHLNVAKKSRIDLVTDVDQAVNDLLCKELSFADKNIDVIAEEGVKKDLRRPDAKEVWVIDPIDGTTNFVHDLMHSAISIALYDRELDSSLLGLVLNPFRNECFTAIKNGGAFLNQTPITVSKVDTLLDSVICTGFSYDQRENPDNNLEEFSALMREVQGMRRFGAASLDLAYVACGRFDGYFEKGLKFWDYAAGMLLVTEAGGIVSAYDGSHVKESTGHILASNQKLYPTLLSSVKNARMQAGLNILPNDPRPTA